MSVHFSSKTIEWGTPPDLFEQLRREFDLRLDVCATPGRQMLPRYFSPAQDGLAQSWAGERCYMNPPYGRQIRHWVRKAAESGAAIVVALLPARTDTAWWHDFVIPRAEVRFLRGRLRFTDASGAVGDAAPFPSAIVIWR